MEHSFIVASAEFLVVFLAAGVVCGLWRLPNAVRPDIMLSFVAYLVFSALREIPVIMYSVHEWPSWAAVFSASARVGQILAALGFIRAVTAAKCGEWAWLFVLLIACVTALAAV